MGKGKYFINRQQAISISQRAMNNVSMIRSTGRWMLSQTVSKVLKVEDFGDLALCSKERRVI